MTRNAELYAALETLLPFAELEIDLVADFITTFPDDEDHVEDCERAVRGQEALKKAKALLASRRHVDREAKAEAMRAYWRRRKASEIKQQQEEEGR